MFARTYAPSKVPEAVQAWRGELQAKKRTKLAAAVADPTANPELFEEGWEEALQHEASAPAPGGAGGPSCSSRTTAPGSTSRRWAA